LPDGEHISLGEELFQCTEILFQPKMMGVKTDGIHFQLSSTFKSLDNELISLFSKYITFAGGSTLIKGFPERIKREFQQIYKNKDFVMSYNEKNINSAWLGGSLISSLSSFQTEFVDKKDYDEFGSIIIQRKCFY